MRPSSSAAQYAPRYNVTDYQMWEGDWELWDGIAIAMTPSPFGPHQAAVAGLLTELRLAIRRQACRATALAELDWIVRGDTVVRPDVVVVCGEVPERHLESAPALVAEVLSSTTRQNDLTFKRELYAEQGVPTYLIVDPDSEKVEQLTLDQSGEYRTVEQAGRGQFVVCDGCRLRLDFDEIFRH